MVTPAVDLELDRSALGGTWLLYCLPRLQGKQLYSGHHRSVSRAEDHHERALQRGQTPDVCRSGNPDSLYPYYAGFMGSATLCDPADAGHRGKAARRREI